MKNLLVSSVAALLLSGCAGYHLGSVQPHYLRDVHTIDVPTFRNLTLVPRVEALVTGTVIKQLQQDGTYRIATGSAHDAVLKGDVIAISRTPARSVRGNVLATTEFTLTVALRYSLVDPKGAVLTEGTATGGTSFFVSSDINTDERQALPIAIEELAKRLVSQLSEGW